MKAASTASAAAGSHAPARPPPLTPRPRPAAAPPRPIPPGLALQLRFFTANGFGLLFALLWLFLGALSAFCYLLSTFVSTPQAAVSAAFVVFLVRALLGARAPS